MKAYFGRFKSLEEIKIVRGNSGEVKGFGYLKFNDLEEAKDAIGLHKIFGKMVSLFARLPPL